jgi:hypothetical protein
MDFTDIISNEIWMHIIYFLPLKNLLILRFMNKRINGCVVFCIREIQKCLELFPKNTISLSFCKIIGVNLKSVDLIWTAKGINFDKPVSDQQPRNANRGLGLSGNKWVWIRGSFKSNNRNKENCETHLCVFQEDDIFSLCRYMKLYEVELLCNFIDQQGIGFGIQKSKDNIISPVKLNLGKEKSTCLVC